MSQWVDGFFDDVYARWCMTPRPRATLAAAADFIERALELSRPSRIFDQCSGIGQIALQLGQRGHEVFGVERNPRYVAAARYVAERDARPVTFIAGDAAQVEAPWPCDAAISWYTSFGFAADAAEDERWLSRLHASLKPAGGLLLDVGNRARVDAAFSPRLSVPIGDGGQGRLTRDCEFDRASGVMQQRWRFELPGGEVHERASVVRIYSRDELGAMLAAQGFAPPRWFGSVAGEPLREDSERCIVVSRRRV